MSSPFLLRGEFDSLWLTARNDRELYVSWRLSARTARMVEQYRGNPQTDPVWLLRLEAENVASGGRIGFDREVEPAGSLYWIGAPGGSRCSAVFGCRGEEGSFVALFQAAEVLMPGSADVWPACEGKGMTLEDGRVREASTAWRFDGYTWREIRRCGADNRLDAQSGQGENPHE